MLTIWKLGVGSENYYLDKVATGIEDYYSGDGEPHGEWLGRGAARLRLRGEVAADQLHALMTGIDPNSGQRLVGRPGTKHVAGWDLTFAAPKSVSILYGLGDEATAGEVVAAHKAAVAAALTYLEHHATVTRRRIGGDIVPITGEGLVVAAFRHRTSRAGDPHLHTHALAVNAVERAGGGWGALHSPILYRHARTAGFVYQAILRSELTQRLAVSWEDVHSGYAEIAGIDQRLLRQFSKRHAEIEAELADAGENSARAARTAQRRTKAPKTPAADHDTLHNHWQYEAREQGCDRDITTALVYGAAPHPLADQVEHVVEEMTSATGLTSHHSTFERRDVVRAWCDALDGGTRLNLDQLEGLTSDALKSNEVRPIVADRSRLTAEQIVQNPDEMARTATFVEGRWSTAEMLATERRLLDDAAAGHGAGVGHVVPGLVEQFLAQHSDLTAEQTGMVRRLTTSGDGIDIVVGRAGTGKTYALAAAANVWRSNGYHPLGLGLAARAAHELETTAGIPSTTIARFLIDIGQTCNAALGPNDVVIVDEAGMVDTRRLARVIAHAKNAGAKVVLVGDHHQLPAVEAGGAFAALVNRLGAMELTENRRQRELWERDTLVRLRTGAGGRDGIAEVIAIYGAHGRIHLGQTPADARAAMVTDWYEARSRGDHAAMIALRRSDVAELNCRARALLVVDGTVAADGIDIGGRTFAIGDRVVCLDGDRRIGVHNALFGAIVGVDATSESVTMELGNTSRSQHEAQVIDLPRWYVGAGHLDHAYATTIHKTQGATHDHTLLLGDEGLYRQAGYTGLSRGRNRNDLYIVADDDRGYDPQLERHNQTTINDEPLTQLVRSLDHDGAKTLATTQRAVRLADPVDEFC